MTRSIFALIAGLLMILSHASAEPLRPNILYFYVDDMGWGSIGPNGQAERRANGLPSVRTPNLDELARQGMNFKRGYGCFVCSPARSSQQTGFHQGHTFADRNDPDNAKKAIRADDITMGDALSAANYVTGYWGKWGYGGSKDKQNPKIDNVQTLPTSHGYQHVLAELHHVRAHTFFQPTLWHAPAKAGSPGGLELVPNSMSRYQKQATYPELPANQNHADYPSTAYCDDCYAFAALDFVREQSQNYKKTGQPFFGLLAVQIPHAPFDEVATLPEWDAAYRNDEHFKSLPKQSQQWAAMVTRIDHHFGNILVALSDPNNDGDTSDSVVDNTLVIFQSDNGGPAGSNNKSFDANGGLSGNKGKIEEGGIRVPLVMRWPGKIKAGSTHEKPVDVTDLLPTFCELAGADIPLGVDGVSLAPTLSGEGKQRVRDFLIHEAGNGQSIVCGDQKLIRTVIKKRKKITQGPVKFFNLREDPAEKNDIAKSNPDAVREHLKILLDERVDEPKGFANTYHHWTGIDGATTSDAKNWSDYEYANAAISYMKDAGPPQLSWIARIRSVSDQENTAVVDDDLSVLALAIAGNSAKAIQTVKLGDHTLWARNELRLQKHGHLTINGGQVRSMRWLTIANGGKLSGHGKIDADLESNGVIEVQAGGLEIAGDFAAGPQSQIKFDNATIKVSGAADIAGELQIETSGLEKQKSIRILSATKIVGKFDPPKDATYQVLYSNNEVIVKLR